jgi:hypothetical protein
VPVEDLSKFYCYKLVEVNGVLCTVIVFMRRCFALFLSCLKTFVYKYYSLCSFICVFVFFRENVLKNLFNKLFYYYLFVSSLFVNTRSL